MATSYHLYAGTFGGNKCHIFHHSDWVGAYLGPAHSEYNPKIGFSQVEPSRKFPIPTPFSYSGLYVTRNTLYLRDYIA